VIDQRGIGGYLPDPASLPNNFKEHKGLIQFLIIHFGPPSFTLLSLSSEVNRILHINNDDVAVTRAFVQAGKLLDVEVLDHLVIGQGKWVSLKERGLGFS